MYSVLKISLPEEMPSSPNANYTEISYFITVERMSRQFLCFTNSEHWEEVFFGSKNECNKYCRKNNPKN